MCCMAAIGRSYISTCVYREEVARSLASHNNSQYNIYIYNIKTDIHMQVINNVLCQKVATPVRTYGGDKGGETVSRMSYH